MACPTCDTVFTPPGEDRVSQQPVRPVRLEPDEDTPPPPPSAFVVDLSGKYQASLPDWFALAWQHYTPYNSKPALSFIALHIGLIFICSIYAFLLLFRAPFACGFFLAAVRQIRGDSWNADTPYSAYHSFWRLLGANLFYLLLYWLTAVLLFLLFNNLYDKLPPVGLAIVATIGASFVFYIHVRLWPLNALIVERDMTFTQALRASLDLTRGHVLAWSGFILVLMGLVLVGIATFGIGLFFIAPYITLAEASAYLHATGQVRVAKIKE
jgi:hypothetical protein